VGLGETPQGRDHGGALDDRGWPADHGGLESIECPTDGLDHVEIGEGVEALTGGSDAEVVEVEPGDRTESAGVGPVEVLEGARVVVVHHAGIVSGGCDDPGRSS
jgi:hypothetical protein